MNKICYGCGAKLQFTDKDKKGYIPEKKYEDSSYCMRCFRMIHYGENKEIETPKDIHEIINKINKDNKFVIFLVDFLNINSSIIDVYRSIKRDKLLIVNKCELIPDHVYKDKLREYLKDTYSINGDIILKGGTKSHGINRVLKYLVDNRITEAYILGISNSGKSTVINDLIDALESKQKKITVNSKANTTLDFIRVKLNNNLTLIDSPGFIMDDNIVNDTTGKKISAYAYQMKDGQTVSLLDGKFYIKFEDKTNICFYTNLNANKPITKYYQAAPNLVNSYTFDDNTDIVLKGIGFISVKTGTKITTNIDSKYLEIRNSMFGGKNE